MSGPKHHFFVAAGELSGERVRLTGDEAHHAARVLRVTPGAPISIADGTGRVVDAVVTRCARDGVDARVVLQRTAAEPEPALTLYQGLARRERIDLVVQKAVEIGARRIVVFGSERSVLRWDTSKRRAAEDRWMAIALAAAKQCRSPWLTAVDVEADIEGIVGDLELPVIVLAPGVVSSFRDALPGCAPKTLGVVVGPEGGLSETEIARFSDAGATAATLGERILRTETAGPVALALAAYSYGSLG